MPRRGKDNIFSNKVSIKNNNNLTLGITEEIKEDPMCIFKNRRGSKMSITTDADKNGGFEVFSTGFRKCSNLTMVYNSDNSSFDNQRTISPLLMSKGKKLTLKVLEGTAIPPKTILNINPGGILGSKRNEQDGVTYFGTEALNVSFILPYRGKKQLMITN